MEPSLFSTQRMPTRYCQYQVHNCSGVARITYISGASKRVILLFIIGTAEAGAKQRPDGCEYCWCLDVVGRRGL
jgi:hypothetical protein